MKNIESELKKKSQPVVLSRDEKAALKQVLFAKIDAQEKKHEHTVIGWQQVFSLHKARYIFASILVVLLASAGGVSAAAAEAQPGDSLYYIKVEINEEVQEFFVFNTEAKARFNTERVERRLEEVRQLVTTNDVEESTIEMVQEYFVEHLTDSLEQADRVADANTESALTITVELETVLNTQEERLEALAITDTEDTPELLLLVSEVNQQQAIIDAIQEQLDHTDELTRATSTGNGETEILIEEKPNVEENTNQPSPEI